MQTDRQVPQRVMMYVITIKYCIGACSSHPCYLNEPNTYQIMRSPIPLIRGFLLPFLGWLLPQGRL